MRSPLWSGLGPMIAGALLGAAASLPAHACWEQAGLKYGIQPELLHAIAKTESGLDPRAINRRNADGSYDVGLMQINSAWFPQLRLLGIDEAQLWEPCLNIEVGAWILAQNMRRLGRTWDAVGAYNATSPQKRLRYAMAVYRNLPEDVRLGERPCGSRAVGDLGRDAGCPASLPRSPTH